MSDIHIPDDLQAALAQDDEVAELFATLSPSHKREYIKWIEEAKKGSTRVSRISRVVNMVRWQK